MKKQSTIIIIAIICVIIIGGSILAIKHGTFSHPQNQNAPLINQEQPKNTFPDKSPLFTYKLTSQKITSSPSDLQQQSIIIYLIDDNKKPVFQRSYYADGFNGNELTYLLATNADSFKQRGTLGTLGCTIPDCSLPWSNFYIWNTTAKKFILDNAAQKDDFNQLLVKYTSIDKKGCSLFTQNPLPNQQDLSLSELYQEYPTDLTYCKTTQGLNRKNLVFFLQAEKSIREILKGENLSSNDIKDTSL